MTKKQLAKAAAEKAGLNFLCFTIQVEQSIDDLANGAATRIHQREFYFATSNGETLWSSSEIMDQIGGDPTDDIFDTQTVWAVVEDFARTCMNARRISGIEILDAPDPNFGE